jgi:hypothetical protein
MKNKYIIGALLVGIISLFASCSDDNDSNPTLIQPSDFGTKKMQTSAKKACFQFAECSFSSANIRFFLVTSKVFGKKYLKRMRRKRK